MRIMIGLNLNQIFLKDHIPQFEGEPFNIFVNRIHYRALMDRVELASLESWVPESWLPDTVLSVNKP